MDGFVTREQVGNCAIQPAVSVIATVAGMAVKDVAKVRDRVRYINT